MRFVSVVLFVALQFMGTLGAYVDLASFPKVTTLQLFMAIDPDRWSFVPEVNSIDLCKLIISGTFVENGTHRLGIYPFGTSSVKAVAAVPITKPSGEANWTLSLEQPELELPNNVGDNAVWATKGEWCEKHGYLPAEPLHISPEQFQLLQGLTYENAKDFDLDKYEYYANNFMDFRLRDYVELATEYYHLAEEHTRRAVRLASVYLQSQFFGQH